MTNFIKLDESSIQMEFGILGDVKAMHTYQSGELESVKLEGKNMLVTHAGELIPAYTETARRKQKPSLEFYKDGVIKSVALEKQTEIETPIGEMPAEYVHFYNTGEVKKALITDGQLSGFWGEDDEKEYAIPLQFDLGFAKFTARLSSITFYKDGGIKSITLFPGEKISIETTAGPVETGIGFSIYESGKIQTIEPKGVVVIDTYIGRFLASNPSAVGITADNNSLKFDEEGRICSFCTVENKILVQTADERFLIVRPIERTHPLYDDRIIRVPLVVAFDYTKNTITFTSDIVQTFSLADTKFTIQNIPSDTLGCTPADCATCNICNKS